MEKVVQDGLFVDSHRVVVEPALQAVRAKGAEAYCESHQNCPHSAPVHDDKFTPRRSLPSWRLDCLSVCMEQHAPRGVLKETAIAIGGAAGKLAALAKAVMPNESAAAPVAKRTRKLPAKKKAQLPRKQKKMLASKKSA
jgi:hypothetical protein